MSTAHKTEEELIEHYDPEHILEAKCTRLAEMIAASNHFIGFTGAGISTACGIPDFRGPTGVWTLQAKGETRKGPTTDSTKAIPSRSHMALVQLALEGRLKHHISQNTDGLHRKSGLPPEMLSELHGNTNKETCAKCKKEYMRDFRTRQARGALNHETDRQCVVPGCGGTLLDSIINFGENLPEKPLRDGFAHAERADLCLVLGSSLRVTPAADMPGRVAERRKDLVIVNLQTTPYDSHASLRIYAKCDEVMQRVMDKLGYVIPEWRLVRHIRVRSQVSATQPKFRVRVEGASADGLPYSLFRTVGVATKGAGGAAGKALTSEAEPFQFDLPVREDHNALEITMNFMGHYREPALALAVPLDATTHAPARDSTYVCVYNPYTRDWAVRGGDDEVAVPTDALAAASID